MLFKSPVYLIIFCLLVLPVLEQRVLKSPTTIAHLSHSYSSICFYLMCFEALLLGT